ncbi:FecCD family ABC transporter permease [Rubrimonas cliftonensis]|uniref:Iron complex transport system permease protein n=1 Tax=Rubrimonas cliftonensis TaxID=89524 RepID=A0A1H4EJZ1_9RHOB|nr:iron ABC transporter permease [Rubrimonas cliftonensis]SEA84572.1 iron complex transport system permease protein [Rubrimonas cliftonensis]
MSGRAVLAALAALVAALFALSLTTGPAGLGAWEGLRALALGADGGDAAAALVMRELRLPRAILGLAVGATLGLSGAALQGYLRNPLAEPGLIGASAGATLGAVLTIHTGLAAAFALALPLAGLGGALVAVAAVTALAGGERPSGGGALTLILAGVAVTSLMAALTSLALNLSPNPFAAVEIVFWMLGSLTDRSMLHVQLALPFMALGWALLATLGRGLDALTLGEDAAASIGTNLARLRLCAVLGTAASVGAATSVSGAIGFVGLVAPHLMRPLVGAQPSRLLPAAALAGAALVLAADVAVRLIAPERDLKLGVVTALIGAPFFLWLVWRARERLT